jgi:hypothetical protein
MSETISTSSHPQACLIFLNQKNLFVTFSHCFTNFSNSGVLFSAEPPAYLELGNKVTRNPTNYAAKASSK